MRSDDVHKVGNLHTRVMGCPVLLHQHCNWLTDYPDEENLLGQVLCPEEQRPSGPKLGLHHSGAVCNSK